MKYLYISAGIKGNWQDLVCVATIRDKLSGLIEEERWTFTPVYNLFLVPST